MTGIVQEVIDEKIATLREQLKRCRGVSSARIKRHQIVKLLEVRADLIERIAACHYVDGKIIHLQAVRKSVLIGETA